MLEGTPRGPVVVITAVLLVGVMWHRGVSLVLQALLLVLLTRANTSYRRMYQAIVSAVEPAW